MKYKFKLKHLGQIVFALFSVALFFVDIDFGQLSVDEDDKQYVEGEIISSNIGVDQVQNLDLILQNGEKISIKNNFTAFANEKVYAVGDKVVLDNYEDGFYIVDYVRKPALALLFGLFVVVVLLVNRRKGIYSLLSMGFSFLVLFKLLLPLLLIGVDPVLAVLLGAGLMLPVIFYLSHGFNRKTTIAMVGTLVTLTITGILATIFTEVAKLSGLATEEAGFLKQVAGANINFQGLLLAGMIISILGVLDDVTITQTSVVEQLKASKNRITFKELYTRSMSVGRDHIASVVNTLILVYAGASLPLLLLFVDASQQSIGQILNLDFMAEEIVRTLVGSIGLVLAVPITTLFASFVYNRVKKLELDHEDVH